MLHVLSVLFALVSVTTPPVLANDGSPASPQLIVHLLDYIAKDYAGAVQNGAVVSQMEYDEQVEFANIIETNARGSEKLSADQELMSGLTKLRTMIAELKNAEEISKLSRDLQQMTIRIANVAVAPASWPDLERGSKLFGKNCVSCHGSEGRGDGAAGSNLEPAPSNFHDSQLAWQSSPYAFYNTIRLGVPGTGMVAFPQLTDEEVWDLAFYIKSLPYASHAMKKAPGNPVELKDIATLSDAQIAAQLQEEGEAAMNVVAHVRTHLASVDPLVTARNLVNESFDVAQAGDFSAAEKLALRAYLEGIEPLEPKIRANLPGLVEKIEMQMISYRTQIKNRSSVTELENTRADILSIFQEAQDGLAEKKMSPAVAFGATFSIFLREGFEAVLIIVVLISILKGMSQPQAIPWVHLGWILAVIAGLIAWFASDLLLKMSGLSRELLEGGVALLAVVVLLYVGFWLHRYSEIKKWRIFLEEKLKKGLNQQSYLALTLVSFMAVFREGFEVVLFMRAISMDLDATGRSMAGLGVLASVVLLAVLSFFIIMRSRKLPLNKLFQVCSWTMLALAFILLGKGIHSLQEAGFIEISPLPVYWRVDLLGFYSNLQTLIAQLTLLLLVVLFYFFENRLEKKVEA